MRKTRPLVADWRTLTARRGFTLVDYSLPVQRPRVHRLTLKAHIMATAKTKKSIEEQLRALVRLQHIDNRIDRIRKLRGDLPEEIEDLEDEQAAPIDAVPGSSGGSSGCGCA